MTQVELEHDVRQLLTSSSSFGPREIEQINVALSRDFGCFKQLRDAVAELEGRPNPSPATRVRIGVGNFLIGRFSRAAEYLERADGGALALYYLARSKSAIQDFKGAQEQFAAAAKAGYDPGLCALGRVEALRQGGQPGEAIKLLESFTGAVTQTAEYYYQKGATASAQGEDPEDVIALYEKAYSLDEYHSGTLFGLAMENDRRGNDDEALRLYERSVSKFPPHLGTLMNLGLLYEDHGRYDKAAQCFQRVLSVYPEHPRARMFLKDAESSKTMAYNEEEQARSDRLRQIMAVNVTDFELSVRSRNCLVKMGIKTLGDLTKISEQDLLGSKNFGETSLNEIKEMLATKGLRLGQALETKPRAEVSFDPAVMTPDEQAVLSKRVDELQLSVRSRKCMVRLGLNTLGELVRKTGDEMLECKNFGVTSLNEVREKLLKYGLKLRGE